MKVLTFLLKFNSNVPMCVWNGLTLDSCCDTINKETQMAKDAVQDGQLITHPSKVGKWDYGVNMGIRVIILNRII